MPSRIADIVVTITAEIVIIVTQQASKDAVDPWIVDQTRKIFALINKGHNTRPSGSIMGMSVMSTAMIGPDAFEFFGNAGNSVVQ